ncbi:hypothetical protein MTO96_009104 [Rhipicephalus appendiculatus]
MSAVTVVIRGTHETGLAVTLAGVGGTGRESGRHEIGKLVAEPPGAFSLSSVLYRPGCAWVCGTSAVASGRLQFHLVIRALGAQQAALTADTASSFVQRSKAVRSVSHRAPLGTRRN